MTMQNSLEKVAVSFAIIGTVTFFHIGALAGNDEGDTTRASSLETAQTTCTKDMRESRRNLAVIVARYSTLPAWQWSDESE